MKFLIVIIFALLGIMFLYLNLRVCFKISLCRTFVQISVDIYLIRRLYGKTLKMYYGDLLKSLFTREREEKLVYKILMKLRRFFIIRGISFYRETKEDIQAFIVEFYIENNMLKRGVLFE